MAYDGSEGKIITLSEGAALTAEYRRLNPGAVIAQFMGREHIESILADSNCMGIRVYFGVNENGGPEIVMVGADENQDDLLDVIADNALPCPSSCGSSNDLNS